MLGFPFQRKNFAEIPPFLYIFCSNKAKRSFYYFGPQPGLFLMGILQVFLRERVYGDEVPLYFRLFPQPIKRKNVCFPCKTITISPFGENYQFSKRGKIQDSVKRGQ